MHQSFRRSTVQSVSRSIQNNLFSSFQAVVLNSKERKEKEFIALCLQRSSGLVAKATKAYSYLILWSPGGLLFPGTIGVGTTMQSPFILTLQKFNSKTYMLGLKRKYRWQCACLASYWPLLKSLALDIVPLSTA